MKLTRTVVLVATASTRRAIASGLFLVFGISITGSLTGCGVEGSHARIGNSGRVDTVQAVEVEAGDLTSIVVVSGIVEAMPSFVVVASTAGAVHFSGGEVTTGQRADTEIATVNGNTVTLGNPGKVSRRLVEEGQNVEAGVPIALVASAGFGVPVRIPATLLHRMYSMPVAGKVNIDAGPSGVECNLVPTSDLPPGSEGRRDAGPGPTQQDTSQSPNDAGTDGAHTTGAMCLLAPGSRAFAGLSARVGLATGEAKGVLTLPITAVSGSLQRGRVRLLDDEGDGANESRGKHTTVRKVELGITDGRRIQITTGLKKGDRVTAQAPRVDE